MAVLGYQRGEKGAKKLRSVGVAEIEISDDNSAGECEHADSTCWCLK